MKTKLFGAICALFLLVGSVSTVKAQSYNTAIGLNIGAPLGINYKQFINRTGALDFTLGYQDGGVMLTGVFQHHIELVSNFNLYLGGGLNVGMVHLGTRNSHSSGQFALGIDPTVGFEYKFAGAPVALAIDYTPQINIFSHMNWGIAAFKIRFTI